MDLYNFLGYLGVFLGMITFLPQLLQVIRTKETKDLSLMTYSIIFINCAIWIIYGYHRQDLPVILINTSILFISGVIIYYKIKFG